ncbi:MAG: hypothetical protein FJ119_03755 [Deltaproteobacteria bacterium]|nr:hypothetical protein [Deltaproteobacteria bacterium]
MKTLKAGIIIVCMLCMAGPVFAADAYSPCARVPLQEARDAMVSDSEVTVTQIAVATWGDPAYYYELKPNGMAPQDGLIIYPGGYVDERAYAVMARDIAKAGFLVVLVPMPSCLAAFDNEGRASDVIANNPGITTWSIGGHSLGGVAAGWMITCNSCANIEKIKGVVLWASYPDALQPLTNKPVKVISIWGTKDGLTTEQTINNSKPNLPADTVYVGLKGANHTQFGWYGLHATDYTYLSTGTQGKVDNAADISREEQHNLILSYTISFLDSLTPGTLNIPAAVGEVTADDGSVWEKVSGPGFIDRNNTDIVALTPYKGNLYALTRNDVTGFELWKTQPAQGWQRIHVQGLTDQSNYYGYLAQPNGLDYFPPEIYNPMMNIWGDMIEFKDRLYVGVSTGYQGSALFGSSGAFIWRTDGVDWTPVIGGHTSTATGTLTEISSCGNNDGSTTAVFTDSSKSWTTNSLANCTIKVDASYTAATHGESGVVVPGKRLFMVVSNTATALTVQQSEIATATAESTWCAENDMGGGDTGRPWSYLAGFTTGAAYAITCGDHSQGFGDPWNKSIIDFEILNNELYASIGLNYKQGARVMKTTDGLVWAADSSYSFGNIHGTDWRDGSTLTDAECATNAGTAKGAPVSSSATKMVKTSVTGTETLLIGGTGTAGCNGRGARIYRRDGNNVWTPIVDYLVDDNIVGSNESGFGWNIGGQFFRSAFQAWSWVEYLDTLLVGVAKLEAGGMIYHTDSASEDDGAWNFSMGGADRVKDPVTGVADTSPDPAYNGFGDVLNTGFFLHNYNDTIYVGTLVTNQSIQFAANPVEGAEIWKGSGPGDAINWTRVSGDGLGDSTVLQFQSFADYNQKMYLVASTVNSSNFRGNEPTDYTGAVVYRLAEEAPECLDDDDCDPGYECIDGVCEPIPDGPPSLGDGPFLAAGPWPLLPTEAESPMYLDANYDVLWTFSDDFASCSGDCTHAAEYQAVGADTWTSLDVTANAARGTARVTLPVESLQNATTYAFRYSVTDCASQTTESNTYYFRVAVTDAPPVITGGPWLAAGTWPLLPTSAAQAMVLDQNYDVLWTFSDDYAFCSGLCTHRARYRRIVDDGSWIWEWLPVTTDATGKNRARVTLPIESMEPGEYMFYFDVRDCAGQRTSAPKVYYFKVEADN